MQKPPSHLPSPFERAKSGYHQYRAGNDGTLVLIHGFLDKAATWQPFVENLDLPGWAVIALELQDFGLPKEAGLNLLHHFAGQAAEVIASFGPR